MPYDVSDSQPDCKGWATVKQNSDGTLETIGCHRTKKEAIAQMVAVSIATEHERTRVVAQARGLVAGVDLAVLEIAHRQLQLRYNPDQPRDENGRWASTAGGGVGTAVYAVGDAMEQQAGEMHTELFGAAGAQEADVEGSVAIKALTAYRIEARLGDVSTDDLVASTGDSHRMGLQLRVVRGEDWRTVYTDPSMLGSAEQLGFDPATARPVLLQYGTGSTRMVLATNTGFRNIDDPRQDAGWIQSGSREIPLEQGEVAIRRAAVSTHLSNWANSSNDNDPMSLLMQEAAVAEFGLKNTAGWNIDSHNTKAAMDQLRGTVVPVQQKVLRAMYDETQSTLAGLGIRQLSVSRGMQLDAVPDAWLRERDHDVTTRPLSSWAGSPGVAKMFAGRGGEMEIEQDYSVVMNSTVDARQVLSFAGTGLGCHEETEVVLLGGSMRTSIDAISIAEALPDFESDDEDRAYNPNQPRDESGKWTSGGGGGAFVAKINDGAVRDLQVMSVDDLRDRRDLSAEVQVAIDAEIEAAGEDGDLDGEYDVRGYEMMASALDSDGEVFVIPGDYAPDGAMSLLSVTGAQGLAFVEIEYLGTSGTVDGAGTRLFAHAVRVASEDDREIRLMPLDDDAEAYWASMGFERMTPGANTNRRMVLSRDRVRELAERGQVAQLQTVQEYLTDEGYYE